MKKGLRRYHHFNGANLLDNRWKERPDEEGIETYCVLHLTPPSGLCWKSRPDEEGIETRRFDIYRFSLDCSLEE